MRPPSILTSCLAIALTSSAWGEVVELEPINATANRILANGAIPAPTASRFDSEQLSSNRFRDITDALSSYPGFAAYRRTHATAAHPTTQGVRFRNFGANASSRALVLFDGVPQNDPFGGWVYWHRYSLPQIENISLHPGGVGESWGNMASGGLVSIVGRPASPRAGSFQTSIGSSSRVELSAGAAIPVGPQALLDWGLRVFKSDGFHTVPKSQRGPIDQRAYSEASSLNARLQWIEPERFRSELTLRALDEKRGNGTPQSRNATEAVELSYISELDLGGNDARLNLAVYFQNRDFQNVFTAVSDDRASERPALDQYKVPARSFGGSATYRLDRAENYQFSAGLDFRFIEGSVNERFRNLGNGFTRNRHAGGEQRFIGLFSSLQKEFGESDLLSGNIRVETVRQSAGRRTESDIATGNLLRNEAYDERNDTLFSGNVRWRHSFSDTVASSLILFSGYRAPTLNELYRPFRVRNDITESNPSLANERHQGMEISLSHDQENGNRLQLSYFHYHATDMIANALITSQPGFDPAFGFIPEGGSGSLRVNLDRSSVSGFEVQFERSVTKSLSASFVATLSQTTIDADEISELAGNEFPQSSPWKAAFNLNWAASEKLQLAADYRWADRYWENLENTRRLGASSQLDLSLDYRLDEARRIGLTVSNALDEQNVSGIASNGLLTIDEPRELLISFSWSK